jgi:hypothetical protein
MVAVEVGDCGESDLKILCLAGKEEDDLRVGGRQNESRRNRRIHQTDAPFSKPGDLSRLVVDPQPNLELAMVLGGGFRDGIFVSVRGTANVRDADLHTLIGQRRTYRCGRRTVRATCDNKDRNDRRDLISHGNRLRLSSVH